MGTYFKCSHLFLWIPSISHLYLFNRGGDYFSDPAGLRGFAGHFTKSAPVPVETPRIIWWSAVQMRQRAEGRVCLRRGDPRLYKRTSSV